MNPSSSTQVKTFSNGQAMQTHRPTEIISSPHAGQPLTTLQGIQMKSQALQQPPRGANLAAKLADALLGRVQSSVAEQAGDSSAPISSLQRKIQMIRNSKNKEAANNFQIQPKKMFGQGGGGFSGQAPSTANASQGALTQYAGGSQTSLPHLAGTQSVNSGQN